MLEALDCPHCGAPLDIPEGVTRLKCRYCASTLELRENESVRALVLLQAGLQRVESGIAEVASGVNELKSQSAAIANQTAGIAGRIDAAAAAWEARVNKVKRKRRDAQAVGFLFTLLGALAMLGAGLMLGTRGQEQSAPVCFGAVGLLFVLAGLSHANQAARKAKLELEQLEMSRPW